LKSLLIASFALIAAMYPFAVLFGLERFGPSMLGLVLLVVLVVRMLLSKSMANPKQTSLLLVMVVFCLGVAVSDSELLLRFYPVMMSLGMASVFFLSLYDDESLIERFARLAGNDIDDVVKRYTRNVTKVWVLALLCNAVVALYTVCCVSLAYWTYYNGFISYLLFGLLIATEFVYRYFYKKRHQRNHDTN